MCTFPTGSLGGPDGLTDMLSGDLDGKLLIALCDMVNLMLAGQLDQEINTSLFDSLTFPRKTVALSKVTR